MFLAFAASSCSFDSGSEPRGELPKPRQDPDPAAAETLPERSSAVFAGGCFWCVEGVFEELDGVIDARSGYAGGSAESADYRSVSAGGTRHAEVVEVTYDPRRIGYGELLRVFFATHDPTQLDRQGPDVGRHYRSAIFYADEQQRLAAEAYIRQLEEGKVYARPIVTTLEALEAFYPAEDYHQDYVQLNPQQPYIQHHALPKIEKLRKLFPEQVRDPGAPER